MHRYTRALYKDFQERKKVTHDVAGVGTTGMFLSLGSLLSCFPVWRASEIATDGIRNFTSTIWSDWVVRSSRS